MSSRRTHTDIGMDETRCEADAEVAPIQVIISMLVGFDELSPLQLSVLVFLYISLPFCIYLFLICARLHNSSPLKHQALAPPNNFQKSREHNQLNK